MKLAVEFPSVVYREGPEAVAKLASAIETIGYDQLDIFDYVVMGFETPDRSSARYSARMPILEALMTLSYAAAVTRRIGLGTEVLVLPQRQPVLVAKQLSTLDILSAGRARAGIGVGWQASEFEALGESFSNRGARTDEAIALLRACWEDERIAFESAHYRVVAMGMEPKPPRNRIPIWIGGNSESAFRRIGRFGDGWLASQITGARAAAGAIARIHEHAERAGRDPKTIGLQSMVAPPPRPGDDTARAYYADHDRVVHRVAELAEMGFEYASLNATAIFQAGARSADAMIDSLAELHERLRRELGAK